MRQSGSETFTDADAQAVQDVARAKSAIVEQIHRRIVGQSDVIEQLLVAFFSRGHCLFVGVPGLAKTRLISSLAEILNLSFSRIQFTPDLMPADITGTEVLQQDANTGQRYFRFIRGPIFANLLLADEINRTPPKTQAALLQAMQEQQVSAGGSTHPLPLPFMVFATQNPIEHEGTYPLPEAQLDRFMLRVDVGYPDEEEEVRIVANGTSLPEESLSVVMDTQTLIKLQNLVWRVPAADHVVRYAVRLCRMTRPDANSPKVSRDYLTWGAGPRASRFLILGAKARALLDGRYAARIEDVRYLAKPALQHRLVLNFHAEAEGVSPASIVDELLSVLKS